MAAVLAFPTEWSKKFTGFLMGCPLIYLFNVVRIAMLIVVGRSVDCRCAMKFRFWDHRRARHSGRGKRSFDRDRPANIRCDVGSDRGQNVTSAADCRSEIENRRPASPRRHPMVAAWASLRCWGTIARIAARAAGHTQEYSARRRRKYRCGRREDLSGAHPSFTPVMSGDDFPAVVSKALPAATAILNG